MILWGQKNGTSFNALALHATNPLYYQYHIWSISSHQDPSLCTEQGVSQKNYQVLTNTQYKKFKGSLLMFMLLLYHEWCEQKKIYILMTFQVCYVECSKYIVYILYIVNI